MIYSTEAVWYSSNTPKIETLKPKTNKTGIFWNVKHIRQTAPQIALLHFPNLEFNFQISISRTAREMLLVAAIPPKNNSRRENQKHEHEHERMPNQPSNLPSE